MKLTKLLVAAVALCSFANAATTIYTVTTGSTATSSGIANSAGLQFQSASTAAFTSAGPGVVGFGYFNIDDSALSAATNVTTLTSAFQNWNSNGTGAFNQPGPTQQRGVFSQTAAARDIAGAGEFANKFMYVFVGNAATYAASTEFLILKTAFKFDTAESGPTAFAKTVTTANSSVLVGSQVLDVRTTGTDASATPGWRTAVLVPETSTMLLGALGALGLLRRRR